MTMIVVVMMTMVRMVVAKLMRTVVVMGKVWWCPCVWCDDARCCCDSDHLRSHKHFDRIGEAKLEENVLDFFPDLFAPCKSKRHWVADLFVVWQLLAVSLPSHNTSNHNFSPRQ